MLDLPPDLAVAVSKPVASLFPAPAFSPVLATNDSKTVSWQSAGDSYSAGQGLRDREGICARSPRAYGPTAADLLGDRGWVVSSETYVACSGAVIEQYFNGWEVPWGPSYFERVGICAGNPLCAVALPGGTSSIASQWEQSRDQGGPGRVDVMTLSFGGNDIGFADVLSDCVTLPNKWDVVSGCDIAEWELKSRISNLLNPPRSCTGRGPRYELGGADRYECDLDLGDERGSIVDFYVKVVEEKLTDRGQLYVVGYPKLFAPVNEWPGWIKTSCQAVLRGDTEKLGRVAEHLNVHLRSAVTRANERLGGAPRVHYIDLLAMYRHNQAELCGTKADWLHGLFAPPVTTCCSFHPNAEGYKKTAERLAVAIETSFSACPDRADNRGLLAYGVEVDGRSPSALGFDIWLMDASTGADRCRLVPYASQPAWSPDGTRLAFVHKQDPGDDNEIWVMNADGTNPRNLTGNSSEEFQPAWSPDGTRIAYVSNQGGNYDIWVMNADGTNRQNLTNRPDFDREPAWSPDGTRIAFSSERIGGDLDIWVINSDGTGVRNLHDNDDDEFDPTWSPDGTRIAFVHNQDEPGHTDYDIWVMDADGTNWRNLTNRPADEFEPAWSPDGTRIAFVSDQGGNNDIWVVNQDATNPRNLTNTRDQNEGRPAWSPPGDRQLRVSWGSDASGRSGCPEDTTC
ncbi:MAG: GDSL-type esterase/lipase family protein, partial [bacterium]|nr:GDSL-type esterase/lipase family protein [bacterium]